MSEILNAILNIEAVRVRRGHPQSLEIEASPLSKQVGGDHYKDMKIQPIEFSIANNLNACQHTAVKYIVRKKGDTAARMQDIDKAIHILEIYKEMIAQGDAE